MTQRCKPLAVLAVFAALSIAPLSPRAQGSGAEDAGERTRIAATRTPSGGSRSAALMAEVAITAGASAETVSGLQVFWSRSDLVGRTTLFCLAIMFLGGAHVVLRRSWDQQILLRDARTVSHRFWTAPNLYEAVRALEPRSAFRAIAEEGLEAATHREGRLTDQIGANEWIAMCLHRSVTAVNDKLQRGMALLETIGSTAPLIGLFGTVWGIHRALTDTSPLDGIAVPVGAALVMAAVGLAIAVLAILGGKWLARRNKTAIDSIRNFAQDVQAVLISADGAITTTTKPSRR